MVPHDRFTDLRRPPSAIARSSTIEHDIMRRVREWMAGGPPPHGLPSLRQPPTARAVEDCLDETAVLMDQSPDPPAAGATAGSSGRLRLTHRHTQTVSCCLQRPPDGQWRPAVAGRATVRTRASCTKT